MVQGNVATTGNAWRECVVQRCMRTIVFSHEATLISAHVSGVRMPALHLYAVTTHTMMTPCTRCTVNAVQGIPYPTRPTRAVAVGEAKQPDEENNAICNNPFQGSQRWVMSVLLSWLDVAGHNVRHEHTPTHPPTPSPASSLSLSFTHAHTHTRTHTHTHTSHTAGCTPTRHDVHDDVKSAKRRQYVCDYGRTIHHLSTIA